MKNCINGSEVKIAAIIPDDRAEALGESFTLPNIYELLNIFATPPLSLSSSELAGFASYLKVTQPFGHLTLLALIYTFNVIDININHVCKYCHEKSMLD